jgi:hypothetical protein
METYRIAVLIALNVIFFSCSKQNNSFISGSSNNYTDIEIFKGVVFLDGPVVDKLGDFKELGVEYLTEDKVKIENIRKFRNQIIDNIAKKNPNYFTNFKNKMLSGNYELIREELQKVNETISVAIPDISSLPEKEIRAFTKELKSAMGNNPSIKEIKVAIKKSVDNKSEVISGKELNTRGTHYDSIYDTYKYIYLAIAAAVAAVLILIIFAAQEEIGENQSFLQEEFYSTIAKELR